MTAERFTFDPDEPLAFTEPETLKANAALNDYAALGPGRSISILHQKYMVQSALPDATPPPTTNEQVIRRWSAAYAWQARVRAHDDKLRAQLREQRAAQWAERAEAEREASWQAAQKLRQRALDMLDFPLTVEKTETEPRVLEDGRTLMIEKKTVIPAKWYFKDVALFLDIATKLARLSAELEGARSVVQLEGLNTRDLEQLSTEQLQALKAQLEAASK